MGAAQTAGRRSSVGQSTRFIPAESGVRSPPPPPLLGIFTMTSSSRGAAPGTVYSGRPRAAKRLRRSGLKSRRTNAGFLRSSTRRRRRLRRSAEAECPRCRRRARGRRPIAVRRIRSIRRTAPCRRWPTGKCRGRSSDLSRPAAGGADVYVGEHVQRGQIIAKAGSTGPHLFLEVRKDGRPINPLGL
jgi:hypothetical protein